MPSQLPRVFKQIRENGMVQLASLPNRAKELPKWAWGLLLTAILVPAALSLKSSPPAQAATSGLPGSETLSTAALGISVLLKLGVVVLLIYVSLFILKRWQVGTVPGLRKQVTVLETTHLAPRQALHLVQIGSQVFLIGATDQSVSLLSKVEEDLVASSRIESFQVARQMSSVPDFAAILTNVFGKR